MLLGTFLIVSTAFAAAVPYAANQTVESCNYLYREYPYAVHFPGSSEYEYQNTMSWSTDSWMGPACVFTPSTPAMISTGIELLAAREVPFAIRGGGWMPVSNAANIGDNGILFSNTNITSITVSENKTSVTLGAGVRFAALYKELESYNLGINGIRQGDIGVTGFHVGGGIGFYAWELGLSASTVNWFECVLGNATVVRASATENTDLFWALKGGGNNFCYITSLNVPAFPSKSVALGDIGFGSEVFDRYAQSITDFALYAGTDPKSSMEGQTRWNPARNPNVTYHAYLFNSQNNAAAPGLANFSAPVMHAVTGNITNHTMNTWFNSFQTGGDKTNRKRFIFHTLPANVEAYKIAQTTYYETVRELEDVRGFFTAFSVMPATLHMLEATTAAGGSAIDFAKEPQLWIVLSPSWKDGEDDLRVDAIHAKANEAIAANLKAAGYSLLPFIYLNDSAKGQAVFEGYGQTNWDRLKAIAQQYDPAAVFQNLVTGACKVTASRGESN